MFDAPDTAPTCLSDLLDLRGPVGLCDRGAVEVIDPAVSPLTFAVAGDDMVHAVLRDRHTFSSRVLESPATLLLDPHDHDRTLRTINRAFTPRPVAPLEQRVGG
jgi:cytochrome P450